MPSIEEPKFLPIKARGRRGLSRSLVLTSIAAHLFSVGIVRSARNFVAFLQTLSVFAVVHQLIDSCTASHTREQQCSKKTEPSQLAFLPQIGYLVNPQRKILSSRSRGNVVTDATGHPDVGWTPSILFVMAFIILSRPLIATFARQASTVGSKSTQLFYSSRYLFLTLYEGSLQRFSCRIRVGFPIPR